MSGIMDKHIYICRSHKESSFFQNIVADLNECLAPIVIYQNEEFDEEAMEDADIVLCILSEDFFSAPEVEKVLKCASKYNKKIIGVYQEEPRIGISNQFRSHQIKSFIRSGLFQYCTFEEKESFLLQIIAFLGKEKPLVNAIGTSVCLKVQSSRPSFYTIDQVEGKFSSANTVSFRLSPGSHKISVTVEGLEYCFYKETLEVTIKDKSIDRFFDLDELLDELGFEDTVIEPNGSKYQGWIVAGKYDGNGTLQTADGQIYQGLFSKGTLISGTWLDGKGNRYIGQLNNWKRHGEGKQEWNDGFVYEGTWDNDKRSGHGCLIDLTGAIIEGTFDNDEIRFAEITYPDKSFYVGEIINLKRHGVGRFFYPNGNKYEGNWKEDKKDGEGIFYWKHDSCEFSGFFLNDFFSKGTFRLEDHTPVVSGFWKEGLFCAEEEFFPNWEDALSGLEDICYRNKNVKSAKSARIERTKYTHGEICLSNGVFYKDEWELRKYSGTLTYKWADYDIILKGEVVEGNILKGAFYLDENMPIVDGVFENRFFIAEYEHFPNWREFIVPVWPWIEQEESLSEEVTESVQLEVSKEDNIIVNERSSCVQIDETTDQEIVPQVFPKLTRDGFAVVDFQNGDHYEGYWKGGLFHGDGKYCWINEDITFVGIFFEGKINEGCFYLSGDMPIVKIKKSEVGFIPIEEFFPNWQDFIETLELEKE